MLKTILPISSVIFLRFFGLFLVLPVLAIHLNTLNANAFLVGLAMSGYALTQMLFQAPFGYLSDRFGRKSLIIVGTIIFAAGSVVCFVGSQDIYTLILGRLLQGAGAVASVIGALVSDLVKEEVRTKAMALIGGSIAIGFSIAMIAGPLINAYYDIATLFAMATIMAVVSLAIIAFAVPSPPQVMHRYTQKAHIKPILSNPSLLIMDLTNFLQKAIMTCSFVIMPSVLMGEFSWAKSELHHIYLPATLLGILAMGPAAVFGEKKQKPKAVLLAGIVCFALAYAFMAQMSSWLFIAGVVLFFVGFNVHEPILQSLASKLCKVHQRGLTLGIFNTFGYLGTFAGGMIGAFVLHNEALGALSVGLVVVCVLWIGLIAYMKNPTFAKNLYLPLQAHHDKTHLEALEQLQGVIECYANQSERLLIIKYDSQITSTADLQTAAQNA